MNYGKHGVKKLQKEVTAKSTKIKKMLGVTALKLILACFICVCCMGFALGLGAFNGILESSPDITIDDVIPTGYASVVYDNEGHEMVKLVEEGSNRSPVTIDLIPDDLAHAFVAIEDERFYTHNGIDLKGIGRALFTGVKNKHFSSGASTITQQLLKNNVFDNWTSERTFIEKAKRKLQEQYLAIQLEKVMTKEQILEYYLNTINLGHSTLGVQAASLRYFNKPVYELELSECAVIAAITQNPSYYDPIIYPEHNADRRKDVLDYMLRDEWINQEQYDEAMADDVYSRIEVTNQLLAGTSNFSYFEDALVDEVTDDLIAAGYSEKQAYYLLYSGGLSIYSTQDTKIQNTVDEIFTNPENYPDKVQYLLSYALTAEDADGNYVNYSSYSLSAYFKEKRGSKFSLLFSSEEEIYEAIEEYKEYVLGEDQEFVSERISITPQPQCCITIEDQSTGFVVAMVGGRGPKEGSRTLNRAYSSYRSPGSTFKVVSTYAPALDTGMKTLASVYLDAPYNYDNGTPVVNYDGGYDGILDIRKAIAKSKNIIAVKTLTEISPELGFSYLQDFGFTTLVAGEYKQTTRNGEVRQDYFSDITQSLALGGLTNGATNFELNAAYAAIANGGYYMEPILYTKVVDSKGNVILDKTAIQDEHRVIKETTAFLLTSAMQDVVSSGTGTLAKFSGQAIAGKTGTSSKYRDVWFAGFTPYYTATVWTGIDNNAVMSTQGEKNLSKKMWKLCMEAIHEGLEYKAFTTPSGITKCTVCSSSGKLPVPGLCDACLKTEYFEEGTVPTEYCDLHYAGWICAVDGLPACESCPFKIGGVVTLNPIESPLLYKGETIVNEDGTVSMPTTTNICQHSEANMITPGYYENTLVPQWCALDPTYQQAILTQGGSDYFRNILGYGPVTTDQNTVDLP